MAFDSREVEHFKKDVLKCWGCGFEALHTDEPYEDQRKCKTDGCTGSMMAWGWNGWKCNPLRQDYEQARATMIRVEDKLEISQIMHDFESFSELERTIPIGVVNKLPFETPIMTAFGSACTMIHGMRRRGSIIEFGVGQKMIRIEDTKDGIKSYPIQGWCKADEFMDSWPK